LRFEATPVVEANRAVAVVMAEAPTGGLAILDVIVKDPSSRDGRLSTFPGPTSCRV